MAGIKIVDLPALGRDLISTDLLELSLAGGTGSRKITGQEIMNASKLSVGNTPIINGAVGQVLFQGTGNVLQESANLFWDNTNSRLGVGTSSPTVSLEVTGNTRLNGVQSIFSNGNYGLSIIRLGNSGIAQQTYNTSGVTYYGSDSSTGGFLFTSGLPFASFFGSGGNTATQFGTNSAIRMTIFSGGNIGINTTTDAGFRLDVNGTARVQTSITTPLITNASGSTITLTTNRTYFDCFQVWSNSQFLVRDQMSVGVIANPTGQNTQFLIGGSYTASATARAQFINTTLIASANNDTLVGLDINPTFTNGAFTAVDNFALRINGGKGVIGTTSNAGIFPLIVRQSGYSGLLIQNATTGTNHTSSYDGLGLWLNYDVTHAKGLLTNFENNGIAIYNGTNANAGFNIFGSTNNIGINTTTDAGFRLDVNGTARVSDILRAEGVRVVFGTNTNVSIGSTLNGGSWVNNGSALLYGSANINTTQVYAHNFITGIFTSTSGVQGFVNLRDAVFAPTSGTAVFNTINATPTINQTGGANGAVRGFYYNPIVTSVLGPHWAIHTTAGRVRFEGLPTSPTGLNAGDIYNDGGTLRIV